MERKQIRSRSAGLTRINFRGVEWARGRFDPVERLETRRKKARRIPVDWSKAAFSDGVLEVRADSWRGFVEYVQVELSNYRQYIYRGQREPDWKFIPSIYRGRCNRYHLAPGRRQFQIGQSEGVLHEDLGASPRLGRMGRIGPICRIRAPTPPGWSTVTRRLWPTP